MKKFMLLIVAMVVFLATFTAGHITANAAPVGTEEVRSYGKIYHKTTGMAHYIVPDDIRRVAKSDYKGDVKPRMVAAVQFTPALDGYGWLDNTMFLCQGSVVLNDNVLLVDILDVWPEGSTPMDTLAVYDNGEYKVPLGITNWEGLFNNSSGWPQGVTEDTFIRRPTGYEQLRDPARNPFKTPYDAWSGLFRSLANNYQDLKIANIHVVETDEVYVRWVSMKRKLFIVAQRQEDCSYEFFFLKSFNKKKPDYSDKNNPGSLEEAIAYLKGK